MIATASVNSGSKANALSPQLQPTLQLVHAALLPERASGTATISKLKV